MSCDVRVDQYESLISWTVLLQLNTVAITSTCLQMNAKYWLGDAMIMNQHSDIVPGVTRRLGVRGSKQFVAAMGDRSGR